MYLPAKANSLSVQTFMANKSPSDSDFERPIEARTQSQEDCVEYISPNSLLLGRAGARGDPGDFRFEGYPYRRLQSIQAEVSKFWTRWSQLAGPNLFIRSKWHTWQRNVAVGDVVWLADQNALRGQYKLARVVSVNTDGKGIVRDARVRTFPSYPVPVMRFVKGVTLGGKGTKKHTRKIPATVLHRDVRRLVILLQIKMYLYSPFYTQACHRGLHIRP